MINAAAFPGISPGLSTCVINGIATQNIVFEFSRKRAALSTSSGLQEVKAVAENCCPKSLWDYAHREAQKFRRSVRDSIGKTAEECALLFTGANIEHGFLQADSNEVMVFATTDVRSNAMRAGADAPAGKRGHRSPGTINIFLFTNASLSEGAMSRSIITITEAKCAALQDMAVNSSYSPGLAATGTGTDNIIVAGGAGPRVDTLRGHSTLSLLIARTVTITVKEALRRERASGALPAESHH